MPSLNESDGMTYKIAPDVIRVAVARVCGNQVFELAKQQKTLLRFLADEDLAGRAKEGSRAAVIAEFYADRSDEDAARKLDWALARLSDKLAEYYDGDGADDPIRIHVDLGTCGLRFELWEGEQIRPPAESQRLPFRLQVAVGGLVAALIIGVVLVFTDGGNPEQPDGRMQDTAMIDDLVLEKYQHLTPEELVQVSKRYLFPTLDAERQRTAIALSQMAIQQQSDTAGAHATVAYALATMATVSQGGALSRRYLSDARLALDQGLAVAPQDPWVLSAAAMTAYAERDFEQAVLLSEQAYAGGADDIYVSGAFGVLALVTARYEECREASLIGRQVEDPVVRMGMERLYAFASFHLGDFAETVTVLEAHDTDGRADNVTSTMYHAAAYQAIGAHQEANAMVRRLQSDWPMFRPESVATLFFQDPEEGAFLLQNLAAAGWAFEP